MVNTRITLSFRFTTLVEHCVNRRKAAPATKTTGLAPNTPNPAQQQRTPLRLRPINSSLAQLNYHSRLDCVSVCECLIFNFSKNNEAISWMPYASFLARSVNFYVTVFSDMITLTDWVGN